MQYPSMGKNRQYRVTIPQLSGGVNYAVPPHLIEDNQLSDVKNMWYKDGRLQTRPGIVYVCDARKDLDGGYNQDRTSFDRFFSFDDMVLAYTCSSPYSEMPFISCALIDNTGHFIQDYALSFDFKHYEGVAHLVSVMAVSTNGSCHEKLSEYYAILFLAFSNGDCGIFGISDTALVPITELYIPTVSVGGKPMPVGEAAADATLLEPYNLLTRYFKSKYTTDGKGVVFSFPTNAIAGDLTVEYTDNSGNVHTHEVMLGASGGVVTEKSNDDNYLLVADGTSGTFKFINKSNSTDAALELSNFGDNVVATVMRNVKPTAGVVCGMTIPTWFGGGSSGLSGGSRLFLAGHPDHLNLVHWSSLNNPLYFPENNYAYVGKDNKRITGFGKQGELLAIFKESEIYCTQYIQGASVTAEQLIEQRVVDIEAAAAVFPMMQIHPEIGCDCPDTIRLCNNRLVWLNSDAKVYGLFTTGQYSERNVRALSLAVGNKLTSHTEEELRGATSAEYENNYLLMIGSTVYVLDYSSYGFSYYSSYSSDEKAQKVMSWYVWDLADTGFFWEYGTVKLTMAGRKSMLIAGDVYGLPVVLMFENAAEDCALNLEDNTFISRYKIPCSFTTKLFDFGYPERLKRINPFYLQVSGAKGETMNLTYFRGDGKVLDDYAPTLTGNGLEEADPIRITPNASRVREFGIGIESSGRMEIGSLTLNYSMMGTVR